MPDADHTKDLNDIYFKMLHELPYDVESNTAIADALRNWLSENPEQIEEFAEIVLEFEPEFYPSWHKGVVPE